MRLHLSRAAREDLVAIGDFVAHESGSAAADRMIDAIFAALTRVAEAPGIGHSRADIADGTIKVWHAYGYLILYTVKYGSVVVLRVRHGARAPWRIDGALREVDDEDLD